MLLQLSTWPEVEAYLHQSTGIILPIGSTEQHGPTGLIGTDAICAEAIAKGVGEAINAMVCPTINVGMALHHTAFPGTISLRPTTLIQLIRDYITCLVKAGFLKFFLINGHGQHCHPESSFCRNIRSPSRFKYSPCVASAMPSGELVYVRFCIQIS